MVTLLALMYIASAVLPVAGIARLYRGAARDAEVMNGAVSTNTGDTVTVDEHNKGLPILVRSIRERPSQVRLDLLLIGAGVALGAAASIWSLFLD
jgi:hypothetical protein